MSIKGPGDFKARRASILSFLFYLGRFNPPLSLTEGFNCVIIIKKKKVFLSLSSFSETFLFLAIFGLPRRCRLLACNYRKSSESCFRDH